MLVTGGAGFIGANFVEHVLKTYPELRVTTLDALTYAGSMENLAAVADEPRHDFVKGDITDRELVDKLFATGRSTPSFISRLSRTSIDPSKVQLLSSKRIWSEHLRCSRRRATPGLQTEKRLETSAFTTFRPTKFSAASGRRIRRSTSGLLIRRTRRIPRAKPARTIS